MRDAVRDGTARAGALRLVVWALAALALGMAAAGLGYGVFGTADDAGLADPPIWPPRWLFWGIWIVLYPTIGAAGAQLWRRRRAPGGRAAWALYVLSVACSLAWVPVVQASGSRLVAPVIMDLVGLTVGVVAFSAARHASRVAATWLLPSLTWGFLTTALKLWRLAIN